MTGGFILMVIKAALELVASVKRLTRLNKALHQLMES
jgi:hypothetical protein